MNIKRLTTLALLLGCVTAQAALNEYPTAQSAWTDSQTFVALAATGTTNKLATNIVSRNTYHTINIVNPSAAACVATLYRGIDGTNFVSWSTNTVAATSTTELALVGKWNYIKTELVCTNQAITVYYLGQ